MKLINSYIDNKCNTINVHVQVLVTNLALDTVVVELVYIICVNCYPSLSKCCHNCLSNFQIQHSEKSNTEQTTVSRHELQPDDDAECVHDATIPT